MTPLELEKELAQEVGFSLSTWANVEVGVQQLFWYSSGMPAMRANKVASKIISFAVMLDMTDATVRDCIGDPLQSKYWSSLLEIIKEGLGDRNNLAHSPITRHIIGGDADNFVPVVGPSPLLWIANAAKRTIDLSEAREIKEDFKHIGHLLREVTVDLGRGKPWPDKFLKPAPRRRPPRGERPGTKPPTWPPPLQSFPE